MAFLFWEIVKKHNGPCRKLESLCTQSSMSCAISSRSCFCSLVISFCTNFADTQIRSQNGMYRSNAYPHLVCPFSNSYTTVLHEQILHLVDDFVILVSWGPTVTWFDIHVCAAKFEVLVPLFYPCDTRGIVPESLLNLSNNFHLRIAKLLAKFDAIPLLKSFRHFAIIDNLPRVHNTYTIIDRQPATDPFYRAEKVTHAHKCLLHIYNGVHFPCLICLCGKN